VPQEIRDTLEFIAVSKMDDVLLHALEAPVVQDETAPAAVPASTN
jgi:ATP-dependent Lon protease